MLAAGAARAAADTFDILSFTAPANWEKTVTGTTVVRFKAYNADRTAFCEFNVFGSRPSAGSALKDFEDEWNQITLNKTPWEGTPKATTIRAGWTAVMASAHIEPEDFVPFDSLMTSFTGDGRVASVVITTSDAAQFADAIKVFYASVQPISQAAAAVPPAAPQAAPKAAAQPEPAAPPQPAAGKGMTTLVVNNHLSKDIYYLYIRLLTDPSWGPNLLQATKIPANGSITLSNMKPGTYQLEADTADHFFQWTSKSHVFPPGGTFTWTVPEN
jgi:hypothetical protein